MDPADSAREPCDGDLVCLNGRCAISTRVNQPNVNVALELSSREAVADGKAQLKYSCLSPKKTDKLRLRARLGLHDPSGIGSLSNGLLTLDEGFGSITWDTCNRRTAILCPEVIRIQLAHRDQPMTPFFESDTIRLTAEPVTTPTRISIEGNCADSIGYTLAVRSPANSPEMLSHPTQIRRQVQDLLISDEYRLAHAKREPSPDSREQLYDTLGPDEISVTTIETTDENGEAVMMQPCLSDGVWVGSQRLNYAQHAVEDGSSETHLTALIELDCIDMNGVQHVIRIVPTG